MVNGAAVLGWGVGGIEAEAAMLGQPISMLIPEVVGFKLTGRMKEGTTATDLVLKVVQMLRKKGVVGKFVEFYGDGLDHLPLADRATIGNMAPEYGATCGFFPIDDETLRYLRQTGRDEATLALVEAYAKANGMWRGPDYDPVYTDTLELDMGDRRAPPSRARSARRTTRRSTPPRPPSQGRGRLPRQPRAAIRQVRQDRSRARTTSSRDGSIVIASITSCTNTSNPYVMIGAGLVARKARALGLTRKPWVKTSLAPGSQVVSAYLEAAGLQEDLDAIGFNLVGYGCTTCIGNSGPLQPEISKAINDNDLIAVSVLSGNRNFEGRISPDVRANYLASPPLVVAYALVGDINVDITTRAARQDKDGRDVYLKDIWPTNKEIADLVHRPSRARRSSRNTPMSSRATRSGRASRPPTARPTTGPPPRPTSRTRPISRA
jgi:aconitate hydratase